MHQASAKQIGVATADLYPLDHASTGSVGTFGTTHFPTILLQRNSGV